MFKGQSNNNKIGGSMSQPVSIFRDRLSKMQQAAAEAMQGYTPGGMKIPDGIYLAYVQCEMTESQSSGNLQIARTFTVADGDYKGLKMWDYIGLEQAVLDPQTNQPTSEKTVNSRGLQKARQFVEVFACQWPENDYGALEELIMQINAAAALCKIRSRTSVDKKDASNFYTNVSVMEVVSYGGAVEQPATDTQPAVEETAQPVADDVEPQDVQPQDELDTMDRATLKQYLVSHDLEGQIHVTIKWTDEDIRNAIRTALSEGPGVPTEDQPAEEAQAEVPVEQPAEAPSYDANALLAFCVSQQISEVEEGMEPDQIIQIMSGYQFKRWEMTDDEAAMLSAVGLGANVVQQQEAAPIPEKPKTLPTPPPVQAKKPTLPTAPAKGKPGTVNLPNIAAKKPAVPAPAAKPAMPAAPAKPKAPVMPPRPSAPAPKAPAARPPLPKPGAPKLGKK
jgi:hypothetical protein